MELDEPFTLSCSIETTDGSIVNVMVISSSNYARHLERIPSRAVDGTVTRSITNATMKVRLQPGAYMVLFLFIDLRAGERGLPLSARSRARLNSKSVGEGAGMG